MFDGEGLLGLLLVLKCPQQGRLASLPLCQREGYQTCAGACWQDQELTRLLLPAVNVCFVADLDGYLSSIIVTGAVIVQHG